MNSKVYKSERNRARGHTESVVSGMHVNMTYLLLSLLVYFSVFVPQDVSGQSCSNDKWFKIIDRLMNCGKHHCAYKDHVSFMAIPSRSRSGTNRKHETVLFDKVLINIGKAYDGHTSVFRCPSPGIYRFEWSICSYKHHSVGTELVHNGRIVMGNYVDNSGAAQTSTASAILKLKKNDKIWIWRYTAEKSSFYGGHWSSFQGLKM